MENFPKGMKIEMKKEVKSYFTFFWLQVLDSEEEKVKAFQLWLSERKETHWQFKRHVN